MGKVIGTTVVRLVLVALFGFYLKFIDTNLAGQVSGWLMNQEQVALSGEIQDPVLSGVMDIQSKIDLMSGLNTQIEESTKMLKQISEKLGIVSAPVITGNINTLPTPTMNAPVNNQVPSATPIVSTGMRR